LLCEDAGKQCCIFDTVSLVKLCQLELGPKRAIQWLLEDFAVWVPQKVFDDGKHNLPTDDDDARTVFFNAVLPRVADRVDDYFEERMNEHVNYLPPEAKPRVDAGEKIATALALELSRFWGQYVVLVTDDYKAQPLLEEVCDTDQIGIVRNAYDLMLFLGSRHSDELAAVEVETAIKQLAYLLRDNSKPAHVAQKPDELRDNYLKILNQGKLTCALPGDWTKRGPTDSNAK
jgi:hypothetical protein